MPAASTIHVLFNKRTKYLLCSVLRCSDFGLDGEGIQTTDSTVFMRLPTSPKYMGTKMLQKEKSTGKKVVIINRRQILLHPAKARALGCLYLDEEQLP